MKTITLSNGKQYPVLMSAALVTKWASYGDQLQQMNNTEMIAAYALIVRDMLVAGRKAQPFWKRWYFIPSSGRLFATEELTDLIEWGGMFMQNFKEPKDAEVEQESGEKK